jgi:hypothetical protein
VKRFALAVHYPAEEQILPSPGLPTTQIEHLLATKSKPQSCLTFLQQGARLRAPARYFKRCPLKTLLLTLALLFIFADRASADSIDIVSQSGVWGASCPPVVCSAPGDHWSYSFETPTNLTFNSQIGLYTSMATDFTFDLNGSAVNALPSTDQVVWFPEIDDGGFAVGSSIAFAMFQQLYTGASSPGQLVQGVYGMGQGGEDLFGAYGAGATAGSVVIHSLPEPPALLLAGIGALGLLALAAKRNLSKSPSRA